MLANSIGVPLSTAIHENMSSPDTRHDYEVILLGDAGVGKTTLFLYLQTGQFVNDDMRLTMGVDSMFKTIKVDGHDIVLKINDTGGSERFRTLTAGFYRHAQVVILMYSMEDQYTLDSLTDWIEECIEQNERPDDLIWILAGNKSDLDNEVDPKTVEAFCQKYKITHPFFISAKNGNKVNELITYVAKSVHDIRTLGGTKKNVTESSSIKVSKTSSRQENNSGGCKC